MQRTETNTPSTPGAILTVKGDFYPTATREAARYWAGPAWDVMTGQMLHPGQRRPSPLAPETKDEQAKAGTPASHRAALTPATVPAAVSAAETTPLEKPRKRRHGTPKAETAPTPLEDRRWLTITETAKRYPYTEGALRHLVFQAEQYAKYPKDGLKSNGFLACIVRPQGARRVLIDAEQFERWLQGSGPAQGLSDNAVAPPGGAVRDGSTPVAHRSLATAAVETA